MARASQGYLVFRVGSEWYGVSVDEVIEVLHMVALNEIPDPDILGVMTLRDRVINVVDLRRRFNLPEVFKLDTPILVVHTAQGGIGLVVDEADDVVQVKPGDLTAYTAEFIEGTFRHKDRPIFVVSLARMTGSVKLVPPNGRQAQR